MLISKYEDSPESLVAPSEVLFSDPAHDSSVELGWVDPTQNPPASKDRGNNLGGWL